MSEKLKGTVKWFNDAKGYGFISREGSKDVFVHFSGIADGVKGHRTLAEGALVEFEIAEGKQGPQATEVREISS